MALEVPYLTDDQIEFEAHLLLSEYCEKKGLKKSAPVPVDEVLENHLGFDLDFDDLRGKYGHEDVLGAIIADQKSVIIDETLDPATHPADNGRYRFTVAHEIGHGWLHLRHLTDELKQKSLFEERGSNEPTIICRSSEKKQRVEIQANMFAASLLMPKGVVFQAWREKYGELEPIVYDPKAFADTLQQTSNDISEKLRALSEAEELVDYGFRDVAQNFAPIFEVSVQAMCIRLENLNLLSRTRGHNLFSHSGASI